MHCSYLEKAHHTDNSKHPIQECINVKQHHSKKSPWSPTWCWPNNLRMSSSCHLWTCYYIALKAYFSVQIFTHIFSLAVLPCMSFITRHRFGMTKVVALRTDFGEWHLVFLATWIWTDNESRVSSFNIFSFSLRLWKVTRFRGSEDWPESGGPPFKVHGVFGCQGRSAFEPLHEWTLLDPLPHEE